MCRAVVRLNWLMVHWNRRKVPPRGYVELADGTGGRFRPVVRLNWLMEKEEGSAPWLS